MPQNRLEREDVDQKKASDMSEGVPLLQLQGESIDEEALWGLSYYSEDASAV